MAWHIRARGEYRSDKRYRTQAMQGAGRAIINRAGTMCGADPTFEDTDRKTATHLRESVKVAPARLAHWLDGICRDCLKRLP
jgi:hypothetical protein